MEYVKKGEIVLNISFGATSGLKMDNDAIRFHARFGGVSREIFVPVDNVMAIYANENGQGMAFEPCWATMTRTRNRRTARLRRRAAARARPRRQRSSPVVRAHRFPRTTRRRDPGDDEPPKRRPSDLTRIK
jgi:stringent starvation protein B